MTPDGKDFLLHLYDKLWENMGAKEARLWSYLSFYGAAIALALGVGEFSNSELYSVIVVLALTVWALLIIINANWWYNRNRMMVIQIEKRFAQDGSLQGVIPKSYQDARFDFDRLYRGSVIVLATLASLIYVRVMWEYGRADALWTSTAAAVIPVLYCVYLGSSVYCISQHESYISYFYASKISLLQESNEPVGHVAEQQRKAINTYSWTKVGFLLLLALIIAFDLLPGRPSLWPIRPRTILGLAAQVCLLSLYAWKYLAPSSPSATHKLPSGLSRWREKLYFGAAFTAMVLVSSFTICPSVSSVNVKGTIGELQPVQAEVDRLEQSVRLIQERNLQLQEKALSDRLSPYITKEEASRAFLSREQARQEFEPKSPRPNEPKP